MRLRSENLHSTRKSPDKVRMAQNQQNSKTKHLQSTVASFDGILSCGLHGKRKNAATMDSDQHQEHCILSTYNVPPHDMAMVQEMLREKIRKRPDRKSLIEHHILEDTNVAPALQMQEHQLKRARLVDDLNDKIMKRPGPLELVEDNILKTDPVVHEALRVGLIEYERTSPSSTADDDDTDQHRNKKLKPSVAHQSLIPTASSNMTVMGGVSRDSDPCRIPNLLNKTTFGSSGETPEIMSCSGGNDIHVGLAGSDSNTNYVCQTSMENLTLPEYPNEQNPLSLFHCLQSVSDSALFNRDDAFIIAESCKELLASLSESYSPTSNKNKNRIANDTHGELNLVIADDSATESCNGVNCDLAATSTMKNELVFHQYKCPDETSSPSMIEVQNGQISQNYNINNSNNNSNYNNNINNSNNTRNNDSNNNNNDNNNDSNNNENNNDNSNEINNHKQCNVVISQLEQDPGAWDHSEKADVKTIGREERVHRPPSSSLSAETLTFSAQSSSSSPSVHKYRPFGEDAEEPTSMRSTRPSTLPSQLPPQLQRLLPTIRFQQSQYPLNMSLFQQTTTTTNINRDVIKTSPASCWKKLKVAGLKKECRLRKICVGGTKQQLIDRLMDTDSKSGIHWQNFGSFASSGTAPDDDSDTNLRSTSLPNASMFWSPPPAASISGPPSASSTVGEAGSEYSSLASIRQAIGKNSEDKNKDTNKAVASAPQLMLPSQQQQPENTLVFDRERKIRPQVKTMVDSALTFANNSSITSDYSHSVDPRRIVAPTNSHMSATSQSVLNNAVGSDEQMQVNQTHQPEQQYRRISQKTDPDVHTQSLLPVIPSLSTTNNGNINNQFFDNMSSANRRSKVSGGLEQASTSAGFRSRASVLPGQLESGYRDDKINGDGKQPERNEGIRTYEDKRFDNCGTFSETNDQQLIQDINFSEFFAAVDAANSSPRESSSVTPIQWSNVQTLKPYNDRGVILKAGASTDRASDNVSASDARIGERNAHNAFPGKTQYSPHVVPFSSGISVSGSCGNSAQSHSFSPTQFQNDYESEYCRQYADVQHSQSSTADGGTHQLQQQQTLNKGASISVAKQHEYQRHRWLASSVHQYQQDQQQNQYRTQTQCHAADQNPPPLLQQIQSQFDLEWSDQLTQHQSDEDHKLDFRPHFDKEEYQPYHQQHKLIQLLQSQPSHNVSSLGTRSAAEAGQQHISRQEKQPTGKRTTHTIQTKQQKNQARRQQRQHAKLERQQKQPKLQKHEKRQQPPPVDQQQQLQDEQIYQQQPQERLQQLVVPVNDTQQGQTTGLFQQKQQQTVPHKPSQQPDPPNQHKQHAINLHHQQPGILLHQQQPQQQQVIPLQHQQHELTPQHQQQSLHPHHNQQRYQHPEPTQQHQQLGSHQQVVSHKQVRFNQQPGYDHQHGSHQQPGYDQQQLGQLSYQHQLVNEHKLSQKYQQKPQNQQQHLHQSHHQQPSQEEQLRHHEHASPYQQQTQQHMLQQQPDHPSQQYKRPQQYSQMTHAHQQSYYLPQQSQPHQSLQQLPKQESQHTPQVAQHHQQPQYLVHQHQQPHQQQSLQLVQQQYQQPHQLVQQKPHQLMQQQPHQLVQQQSHQLVQQHQQPHQVMQHHQQSQQLVQHHQQPHQVMQHHQQSQQLVQHHQQSQQLVQHHQQSQQLVDQSQRLIQHHPLILHQHSSELPQRLRFSTQSLAEGQLPLHIHTDGQLCGDHPLEEELYQQLELQRLRRDARMCMRQGQLIHRFEDQQQQIQPGQPQQNYQQTQQNSHTLCQQDLQQQQNNYLYQSHGIYRSQNSPETSHQNLHQLVSYDQQPSGYAYHDIETMFGQPVYSAANPLSFHSEESLDPSSMMSIDGSLMPSPSSTTMACSNCSLPSFEVFRSCPQASKVMSDLLWDNNMPTPNNTKGQTTAPDMIIASIADGEETGSFTGLDLGHHSRVASMQPPSNHH